MKIKASKEEMSLLKRHVVFPSLFRILYCQKKRGLYASQFNSNRATIRSCQTLRYRQSHFDATRELKVVYLKRQSEHQQSLK